jgi:di/tricarboxylate transporter
LAGHTLAESGLSESFQLRVLGIVRKGAAIYFPSGDERFEAGDRLLVHGRSESVDKIAALQGLTLEQGEVPTAGDDSMGLCEATLAPGSSLDGKTLRELDFRRRYGLAVLSIWRGGRAYRSHLRNMQLQFGDALLLSGDPERIAALGPDDDFLVLASSAGEGRSETDPRKALLAAAIMLAVVVPVLAGWIPIAIAAVAGAAVMVTSRCLNMDEAYRAIEWKSVFLIAGMTPLGSAMASTGAAEWIAGGVSAAVAPFGTWGVLAGLYLLTSACTTIVPTTALVLIMAPIAISMSLEMNLPPQMLMMAIAMAASASFTSPISHPANVLVMGPGGYRFMDYVKLGILLAAVVMLTVLPLIVLFY